jgi:hypothetical protein
VPALEFLRLLVSVLAIVGAGGVVAVLVIVGLDAVYVGLARIVGGGK